MLNTFTVLAQAATTAEPAADTAAQGASQQSQGGGFLIWVPLLVVMVAMIWLSSRGQKKQRERHQQMINGLQKGSRVVLAGGLYGNIVEVKDKTFMVEIAKDTRVEVAKSGVSGAVEEDNKTESK
jgi:preprotein translocase subunit YajC